MITTHPGFTADSIFDIIELLALYQPADVLKDLYDSFVSTVLKKHAKKSSVEKLKRQQRKAYQMLLNILTSPNKGCIEFCEENLLIIQDLVLTSLKTTCNTTQAARLG